MEQGVRYGQADDNPVAELSANQRKRVRAYLMSIDPTCIWCGGLLSTLGGWAPNFPTIEHIWPMSHGGGHEYHNLALAHKRCNL